MSARIIGYRRSGPPASPKNVRPVDLDDVDRRILTALHADARMSNSALADLVGIAASTCHGRVRRLQDLGVIRGFYADIDPSAIGLSLQAMISVSLQSNARGKIGSFIQHIRRTPQVMDVYFLAGADDFILHVAARDTDDLRSFVVREPQRRRRRRGHPDVADLRAPAGGVAAVSARRRPRRAVRRARPEEFTALRKELSAAAKKRGDADAAKEIARRTAADDRGVGGQRAGPRRRDRAAQAGRARPSDCGPRTPRWTAPGSATCPRRSGSWSTSWCGPLRRGRRRAPVGRAARRRDGHAAGRHRRPRRRGPARPAGEGRTVVGLRRFRRGHRGRSRPETRRRPRPRPRPCTRDATAGTRPAGGGRGP